MIRSPRIPFKRPRRRYLIDRAIQSRMILLLVLMEAVMVVVAVGYLHLRFDAIIEQSLYRIHTPADQTPATLMIVEVVQVIVAMVLLNLLALLIADRWWNRHLNRILAAFGQAVSDTTRLDLSRQEIELGHHTLLDLTMTWRLYERQIWLDVRRECERIAELGEIGDAESRARLRESIRRLRVLVNDEQ